MKNERKPLLSDYELRGIVDDALREGGYEVEIASKEVRRRYERLIDEGKLRVVEEVAPSFINGEIKCGKCEGRLGNTYADALPSYCHRCGNKINRA